MWSRAPMWHRGQDKPQCVSLILFKSFIGFLTQLDKTNSPLDFFQNCIWQNFPSEFMLIPNHSAIKPRGATPSTPPWLCICLVLEEPAGKQSSWQTPIHLSNDPVVSPAVTLGCLLMTFSTYSDLLHLRPLLYHIISLLFYVAISHYYHIM